MISHPGEHTIRICVKGEPGESSTNSYANMDSFLIIDGQEIGDTKFIINSEFNYPLISWADYTRTPVTVESGHGIKVYTRIDGNDGDYAKG